MKDKSGMAVPKALAILLGVWMASAGQAESASPPVLRVCADGDNLPMSNRNGEGYENRIAQALARDFGWRIEYTYFPQRMGFVRNTLRSREPNTQQYKCDVIIGVPKGYELTATTRPYMHSTYALVFPPHLPLKDLRTAQDLLKLPARTLRSLRTGVFGRSPGADWLLHNGMLGRAVMYAPQSGDPAENPQLIVERDLVAGKADLAIVWGPIAGSLVRKHASEGWLAVPFMREPHIKFDYEISMGVRHPDQEWKAKLDAWIDSHQTEVTAILMDFQVPLIDDGGMKLLSQDSGI